MDSFEYMFLQRKKIVGIARDIIANKIDIEKGCFLIHEIWEEANFELNEDYYFFKGIASQLDDTDEKNQDYLIQIKNPVMQVCKEIIKKYSI